MAGAGHGQENYTKEQQTVENQTKQIPQPFFPSYQEAFDVMKIMVGLEESNNPNAVPEYLDMLTGKGGRLHADVNMAQQQFDELYRSAKKLEWRLNILLDYPEEVVKTQKVIYRPDISEISSIVAALDKKLDSLIMAAPKN